MTSVSDICASGISGAFLENLVITQYAGRFFQLLDENQVVIVEADTGSGKSTGLPALLLKRGYSMLLTQPRELAARKVAQRISEIVDVPLGGLVGYRTASEKNMDSSATRCLVVTDGLAMVRKLLGRGRRHDLLILDELHEWNTNQEVLVAWVKQQLEQGAGFKLVIMSATMESEKLSGYFNGAPILRAPGRMFHVEKQPAGMSIESDTVQLLQAGRNVLVFQPGKGEIKDCLNRLQDAGMASQAVLLPLHADLSREEQKRCFYAYDLPVCIVATNVAQTSITLPYIDAVVDSGLEKRIDLLDGVETLVLGAISQADSIQRMGRGGRTKDGIYIDHCPLPLVERPAFPVAEFLRTRLDQTVLRLAQADIDAESLTFFHQPPQEEILAAKSALKALGCLDDRNRCTALGNLVSQLPVSVVYARMIVEAVRLGVVDDVITIAAILEENGLVELKERSWIGLTEGENQSDCLAQLRVFQAACRMSFDEMRRLGINIKRYQGVNKRQRLIRESLRGKVRFGSSGDRNDILRAICSGMVNHVYRGSYGVFTEDGQETRSLDRSSVVNTASQGWLVGKPWNSNSSGKLYRTIVMASRVELEWLQELAPHLFRSERGLEPSYRPYEDAVYSVQRETFNQVLIKEEVVPDSEHAQASWVFASWLAEQTVGGLSYRYTLSNALAAVLDANHQQQVFSQALNNMAGENVFPVYSEEELTQIYFLALNGARCQANLTTSIVLSLAPLDEAEVKRINGQVQEFVELGGRRFKVQYDGTEPRVRLDLMSGEAGNPLYHLPDEGLFLANGKPLKLTVFLNSRWVEGVSVAEVKASAEQILQDEVRLYCYRYRPVMALAEVLGGRAPLPEVFSQVVARSPRDDQALMVYASVRVMHGRGDAIPELCSVWCQTADEAENLREEARTILAVYHKRLEERQSKRQVHQVEAEKTAQLLRCLIRELESAAQSSLVPKLQELIRQIEAPTWNWNRSAQVMKWTEAAQPLVRSGHREVAEGSEIWPVVLDGFFTKVLEECPVGKEQDVLVEQIGELEKALSCGIRRDFSAAIAGSQLLQLRQAVIEACASCRQ